MAGIIISGPGNGSLMNYVHIGTLKYVDNDLYLLKGTHKVLLELQHGNRTLIVNTNRKSIGMKLSVEILASIVGFTSHAVDVWRVAGGQKPGIFIYTRYVGLPT